MKKGDATPGETAFILIVNMTPYFIASYMLGVWSITRDDVHALSFLVVLFFCLVHGAWVLKGLHEDLMKRR